MTQNADAVPAVLAALEFAAARHRDQRRKGHDASPYINHVIRVTRLLADVAGIHDPVVLCAAALHDTVEDTGTTPAELEDRFGRAVRVLVEEVTDDKRLPKQDRKRLQVERAPGLSAGARQLKVADKIANIEDVVAAPPRDWTLDRRREYLDWARSVVAGCRGLNAPLEARFDRVIADAERLLSGPGLPAPDPPGRTSPPTEERHS